ncbi:MAG: site-specific tyrosine recombinase XerD [Demequina sp.]|uniref:site-specific tyrosine recombinase XerD n=1 Tax=Demequina sp. TaxID=2050685 RepID=UPI0019930EEE|nr:site-specific tyrosine recombinase XerD [Demequina sp.]MBC7298079.1 site-specific tyrosine recombinase XerD [Demequina sp.]
MAGLGLERELATYLAHVTVERGLSRNTVAAYRRDLGRYVEYLDAHSVTRLADASPHHVSAFAQAVSSGDDGHTALAPASAARTVVAVRGWHRFAVAEGWTLDDAAIDVKPRTTPARLPKALGTDQVESLLEAAGVGQGAGPLRDKALLEVLYASGARVSEAIGLDVDDISLEPGAEAVLLRGKGRKERMVPMGHYAADAVNAYVVRARPALAAAGKGTPALFLNTRGGRLSRQSGWTIIKAAAQRAGIEHVSPHTLRHSFATHLLRGGADIRVVQELLGHASVTTTQVYTLVTRDAMREVYQTAHPRARGVGAPRPE